MSTTTTIYISFLKQINIIQTFTSTYLKLILSFVMKKSIIIALIAIFTAGPVLADGSYRSEPKSKKHCKLCKKAEKCSVVKGLAWVVKLPFRVVTATGYGLYELIADQDLDGFVDGYKLIK